MELDATEWRGGRQCGAYWRHGPRQGPRQADGARSQWEAQVRARGASGGGVGEDGSVPRAETLSAQSERATRTGASAGSVRTDTL